MSRSAAVDLAARDAMTSGPQYSDTAHPIRAGDLVHWYDDTVPSRVVFVLSTADSVPEQRDNLDWYISKFGQGIMLDTPGAGWVLESEDSPNIRPAPSDATLQGQSTHRPGE
jgi:hypothetical protein